MQKNSQITEGGAKEKASDREIALRAYFQWQERGCPEGSPEVDWFQAEEQLKSRVPVLVASLSS